MTTPTSYPNGQDNHHELYTKSISKALAILLTFDTEHPAQRVSDIAAKLQMNKSTVSRHLSTMLDKGYLDRDNDTGMYRPGMALITLAGIALHSNPVYRHAVPELQRLNMETGLHCNMSVPQDYEVIHLLSIGGDKTIELLTPIGHRHPMYCSAMGRAILANYAPQRIAQILSRDISFKYTDETKTSAMEITKALNYSRVQGYAAIYNELTPGKSSIAAPVFDHNREVVAAISLSGDSDDVNLSGREKALANAVKQAAGRISGKLGYFPR